MRTYPLALYRGDTHRWRFLLWADSGRTEEVDLAGVTVAAEIRPRSGAILVTALTVTVTLPNQIDLEIPAATSAQLPASAQWDLQLTYPSGDVQTIVKGPVSVQGDITGSVPLAGTMGVHCG